jgi:hypothetical protein
VSTFAALLTAHPDAVERLIAEHVPDDHGRCRGCTRPGTGVPGEHWPCTPRLVADAAATALRTDQRAR